MIKLSNKIISKKSMLKCLKLNSMTLKKSKKVKQPWNYILKNLKEEFKQNLKFTPLIYKMGRYWTKSIIRR